jgi:hypothetical protein
MNAQRLRNLTTGLLHTNMTDIYEDVEFITGENGVMTHMLPNAFTALQPWLKEKVTDQRFWDGLHDPTHGGELELAPMDEAEKKTFWQRFGELPHPFAAMAKAQ